MNRKKIISLLVMIIAIVIIVLFIRMRNDYVYLGGVKEPEIRSYLEGKATENEKRVDGVVYLNSFFDELEEENIDFLDSRVEVMFNEREISRIIFSYRTQPTYQAIVFFIIVLNSEGKVEEVLSNGVAGISGSEEASYKKIRRGIDHSNKYETLYIQTRELKTYVSSVATSSELSELLLNKFG